MVKKWYFYTSLTIIIAFLSSGFKPLKVESNEWFLIKNTDGIEYLYPSQKKENYTDLNIPFTGNLFVGFKQALGFKESKNKYKKINSLGYLGKYQFGTETLKAVGIHNPELFLRSPKMQEKAFVALLSKNKALLQTVIEKYDGKVVNGILITESGILAAAHLGGAGSVKKYFRYNGKKSIKDAYGTSIGSYLKAFGGYDTSLIEANVNAVASN
ncbi:peptidoglycan-binding protein LysM [Flavobacterium sp. F-380]|uniref:Peptidoglycan-binding protein LysM n=1 Tax=Flavobacterium kayseriense TaxID=2764714 RepID=A0ABR7J2W6_9FLAO|nr:peptidoglycan-binding protein LysM [Flavobacterium kayseriense]MBC5839845.1 peptidoglycan-binding protein LysM [Flavobacterium kayseriense]MBC5847485.1 peptidoglycan-binding protein LysM [Flavobacterium kayseriense]MBU0941426.1 peptidoglycan-binding protein LysM [Bacteroidota bacterium]